MDQALQTVMIAEDFSDKLTVLKKNNRVTDTFLLYSKVYSSDERKNSYKSFDASLGSVTNQPTTVRDC